MKIGVIPENVFERIALATGKIPTPMFDTTLAMWSARTLMAATKLGVFESLAGGPLAAGEVAQRLETHPNATGKLLTALHTLGYLRFKGQRYALTSVARRHLLKESSRSVYDAVMFRFVEWEWLEYLEDFVSTGKPLSIHEEMSNEAWDSYIRMMATGARLLAPEVADRTPVLEGARDMLDIGGSHGVYSAALCRRYPNLRATILDLSQAVVHAEPLLLKEGMGDRVVLWPGNALTEDLGTDVFDMILMAQLLQFLDDATCAGLVRRAACALRPGGCLIIQDVIRPDTSGKVRQTAAFADLYYSLINEAEARSFQEFAHWQADAGLVPQKPFRFVTASGLGQQPALKPV